MDRFCCEKQKEEKKEDHRVDRHQHTLPAMQARNHACMNALAKGKQQQDRCQKQLSAPLQLQHPYLSEAYASALSLCSAHFVLELYHKIKKSEVFFCSNQNDPRVIYILASPLGLDFLGIILLFSAAALRSSLTRFTLDACTGRAVASCANIYIYSLYSYVVIDIHSIAYDEGFKHLDFVGSGEIHGRWVRYMFVLAFLGWY